MNVGPLSFLSNVHMRDEHHFFRSFSRKASRYNWKNKFLRFRQYTSRAWMNLRLQNDKWADIIQICYKSDFQHITYFHTSFLLYYSHFFLFKVMKKTTIVLEMPSGVLSTHNRRTRGAHRKTQPFVLCWAAVESRFRSRWAEAHSIKGEEATVLIGL